MNRALPAYLKYVDGNNANNVWSIIVEKKFLLVNEQMLSSFEGSSGTFGKTTETSSYISNALWDFKSEFPNKKSRNHSDRLHKGIPICQISALLFLLADSFARIQTTLNLHFHSSISIAHGFLLSFIQIYLTITIR